jgi:hypothetical protein
LAQRAFPVTFASPTLPSPEDENMKRRASIPRHPAALIAVVALVILGFPSLSPAQVVLSFDDVAAGPLSTQYATKGATFNLPMVRNYSQTPGFTHSGAQAVELCFAAEFCKGQLNVGFTTNQTHVMVFVGFTSPLGQASPVLMKALDQNGAVVGQATAVLGPSRRSVAWRSRPAQRAELPCHHS